MTHMSIKPILASDITAGMKILCSRPIDHLHEPEEEQEEGTFPVAGVLSTPSTFLLVESAELNFTKQFIDLELDNEDSSFNVRLSVHEVCMCLETEYVLK